MSLCANPEVKPNPESLDCRVSRVLESKSDSLYELDPEIEITLRRLRKARNIIVSNSSNSVSSSDNSSYVTNNSDCVEYSSTNKFAEQMENNNKRTLKELATPDVVYQPWCIQYPQLEPTQTYELKSGLIHLRRPPQILKGIPCGLFHDEAIEDTRRLHQNEGIPILLGWSSKRLAILTTSSLQHLGRHEAHVLGKVLFGIQNRDHQEGNMWNKATIWERFNKLCATCPHLQISAQLLIQYFYEGLTMMDRSLIDAARGGALMDKMPTVVRHLISNMESNTQPFRIKGASQLRLVNEIDAIDNLRLENQLTELTSLVRQLAVEQHQPNITAKVRGKCTFVEHHTDMCPTLQETKSDQLESVGAIGGYQYEKQPHQSRPLDNQQFRKQPFRPGLSQGPYAAQRFRFAPNATQRSVGYQQPTFTIVLTVATTENATSRQFTIFNTNATIEDLKMQVRQLANTSAGSSNLPSQTILNPRGNASPLTLRSGKELPQPAAQQLSRSTEVDSEPNTNSQMSQQDKVVPLSFPTWTLSERKPEFDEKLLKMFQKVKINIPLLDAIKQIPKYAKFLKELCVHKRKKMKGSMEVGGIVLVLTRTEDFTTGAQARPKKCRDPGIFSVPCTIGDCIFGDAMLDLGASINVMPTSIYKSLNFSDLEPTRMTIQLANRSIVQPLGVLKDVLVQVNKLIFPMDFYVLDMEDETSGKGSTLILGRPFLMIVRTKIDMHVGTLSMEFGDTLVKFNIFEAMKHPTEDHSLIGIDLIDELVEECLQLDSNSEDSENFARGTDSIGCLGSITAEADNDEVHNLPNSEDDNIDLADLSQEAELIKLLDQVCNHENPECSIGQPDPKALNDNFSSPPPPMELKPLPSHLKYAYLDTEQQLPIIIAKNLH
ncbi:hypothetical protein CR513_35764, partial [Mucuna pruriens]